MSKQLNDKGYNYYIHSYNGINRLYRIKAGRIHDQSWTLEIYQDPLWIEDLKALKSFMNHYVTGWINEDDALDYEDAIKILKNE